MITEWLVLRSTERGQWPTLTLFSSTLSACHSAYITARNTGWLEDAADFLMRCKRRFETLCTLVSNWWVALGTDMHECDDMDMHRRPQMTTVLNDLAEGLLPKVEYRRPIAVDVKDFRCLSYVCFTKREIRVSINITSRHHAQ